jgi:2-acylglycerol O-acyltransferase 2/2-acylglycerol O-acyltransferase 1
MGVQEKAGGAAITSFLLFNQLLFNRSSVKHWPRSIRNLAYMALKGLINSMGVETTAVGYVNEAALDPKKQYMCGMHPHGALCLGALSWGCGTKLQDAPVDRFSCVADVLLKLPLLGTLLSLGGGRSVSNKTIEQLIRSGANVGIWPGGIFEQLNTSHLKEVCYFQPNKGFIRMAMKHGLDLIPTYVFGENQIFDMNQSTSNRATTSYYVAPFPPIDKSEFFRTLSTRKKEIKVAVGEPVAVEKNANPTDEQVDELFDRYIQALEETFSMFEKE